MRHPDEIFGHGSGTREILFEDGLWCIYRKYNNTYVIHRCPMCTYALDDYGGESWRCGDNEAIKNSNNNGCREEAPDSIKTLYIIHRWDR